METLLFGAAIYAVPVAIVLLTLLAVFVWPTAYRDEGGVPLPFRAMPVPEAAVAGALPDRAMLAQVPLRQSLETNRAESPFWIAFDLPSSVGGAREEINVEFPSRHAQSLACWDAVTSQSLGRVDRREARGSLRQVKAGFAITLDSGSEVRHFLCQARFVGPARISLVSWPDAALDASERKYHRESGALEGGLLVLSIFVLVTALINREWLYVLFAVWLSVNLRIAALSMGWDTQWLGHEVPAEWMIGLRTATMAIYYVLTVVLFGRLFSRDLERMGYTRRIRIMHWTCLPLLLAAVLLPYRDFLPILWGATAFAILAVMRPLARMLVVARSAVAMWYAASIALTLVASLYEVVAAALGLRMLIGSINSVTAALTSSLMAALAISEQMRQERMARVKAEAALRSTYEAIPVGLFTLDASGTLLACNPALREMLGLEEVRREPYRWQAFFADESWVSLQRLAARGLGEDLELPGRPGSGAAEKKFLIKATVAQGRIEGSLQDVTEKAAATERLHYLAEYDPLTNALNRRGIEKALHGAVSDLEKHHPVAIAYLDLDRFKLINDLFGHPTGDEVLRQICQRLQSVLAPEHHLGRVGGDEFVIVFRDTPIEVATETCRRMVAVIENDPCQIGEKAFQVKGSIGLVEVIEGTVAHEAISIADRACREAKRSQGSLVIYERDAPAFRDRQEELSMIGRFGVGRVPDGLYLDMQPIMSLAAPHDSLNFEMLLRLREPDGRVTPAWKLISAAENNGRISLIDRWVLSTTLAWLDMNRARLQKTRFVCVNLSGASLNDEKFIADAFAMLRDAGPVASLLCFEITESVALHDLGNTNRFIDTVRSYGARVALDDFGAGYTSFSYLKELSADAVKIDGSFVRDVNVHPANLAIVEAIAELTRNLGMRSIAEWAEDLPTLQALAEVGVDYVQGYAVARPMPAEKLLAADSAADLIEDPGVAAYVRQGLESGQNLSFWERPEAVKPRRPH